MDLVSAGLRITAGALAVAISGSQKCGSEVFYADDTDDTSTPAGAASGFCMACIRAILFDLGDTLLDFGRVNLHALFDQGAQLAYRYLRREGHDLPPFTRFLRRNLFAIRLHALRSMLTRREFHSGDVMDRLFRKMGIVLDRETLLKMCWLWYEPLHHCATAEEGLREMLAGFRNEGLGLGVVSNTFVPGEVLDRHLEKEGLLEFLPVRVYSCDVGWRKPNRRIFDDTRRKFPVRADETMFVGDRLRTDILGANRAGMVSVLKDPAGRHKKRPAPSRRCDLRPDHHIGSILELANLVATHNR
jgi:FMN phosphatase YigB (HAD superfamily)